MKEDLKYIFILIVALILPICFVALVGKISGYYGVSSIAGIAIVIIEALIYEYQKLKKQLKNEIKQLTDEHAKYDSFWKVRANDIEKKCECLDALLMFNIINEVDVMLKRLLEKEQSLEVLEDEEWIYECIIESALIYFDENNINNKYDLDEGEKKKALIKYITERVISKGKNW